jgi:hypothetical protein
VSFSHRDRYKLINAMRKDVNFLKEQNLMDYSLLLCIEKRTEVRFSVNEDETENNTHKFLHSGKIHHIAIIDYL